MRVIHCSLVLRDAVAGAPDPAQHRHPIDQPEPQQIGAQALGQLPPVDQPGGVRGALVTVAIARARSPQISRGAPPNRAAPPGHSRTTPHRADPLSPDRRPRHCRNVTRPAKVRRPHHHRNGVLVAGARRLLGGREFASLIPCAAERTTWPSVVSSWLASTAQSAARPRRRPSRVCPEPALPGPGGSRHGRRTPRCSGRACPSCRSHIGRYPRIAAARACGP